MSKLEQKKEIIVSLKEINDHELHMNIVDVGLIYDVRIDENNIVDIKITLTTQGCPLIEYFLDEIEKRVSKLEWVEDLNIDIVWDPAWEITMMDEKAKLDFISSLK